MKPSIGVVEGFFGPEWPWGARHRFLESMKSAGGEFYVYAPKRDPYLRKSWMRDHPAEMEVELRRLSAKCRGLGMSFGVGLSPFELHEHWNAESKRVLREKLQKLEELGIDILGLFFDDMKGAPDLAAKQADIVEFTRSVTKLKILFCPTYYSDDPILDKVFGARPPNYLEDIGRDIASDVELLWTGRKVIPSVITAEELEVVAKVLRRKPFLWDNCFANDGPRQCKFLRLRPFEGRSSEALARSSGWALNLMNQPGLSEILFAASARVLRGEAIPRDAFLRSLDEIAGTELGRTVDRYAGAMNEVGLDKLDESTRNRLRAELKPTNRLAVEVVDWLEGKYVVGPECLTD